MSDSKVLSLLEWIKNTLDESLKPSTHTYISPKISVKYVDGSGRGIYSTSEVKKGELILRIPPSFLLNATTVTKHITKHSNIKLQDPHYLNIFVPYKTHDDKFSSIYSKLSLDDLKELSSFQLLSLYLAFEKQRNHDSFWKPFIDMLPEISDFHQTPLVWKVLKVNHHEKLLNMLPESTRIHADKIYERFLNDYKEIRKLVASKLESKDEETELNHTTNKDLTNNTPSLATNTHTTNIHTTNSSNSNLDEYLPLELVLWVWLCINSRCLYMTLPQSKSTSDNFTMAPYVDFLNHSCDDQCTLKIDASGFQVSTTTSYNSDEQLFLSYGPHSNTFLLCEYGFVIPSGNKWNDLDITSIIEPLLKPKQVEYLKEHDYYGDYTINLESGTSFRTVVVLAVLQEQVPVESRRLNALINGVTDGSSYQDHSDLLLKTILERVVHKCDAMVSLQYNDDIDHAFRERKRVIGGLYRNMKEIAEKVLGDINNN